MLSAPDARDLLGRMVAADTHPTLGDADLRSLLELTAAHDPDTGEVTGWNYARAAAEGWRWKAGRASSCFDIATGDQRLSRQQVYAMCGDMAARYGRMDAGSMTVITPATQTAEPEVVVL